MGLQMSKHGSNYLITSLSLAEFSSVQSWVSFCVCKCASNGHAVELIPYHKFNMEIDEEPESRIMFFGVGVWRYGQSEWVHNRPFSQWEPETLPDENSVLGERIGL